MLRKCLSTGNSHHPHAAVERLYLPQFLGRRGIVNIEHLYQRRIVMLSRHLQTSQDPLVKACYQLISWFPPRKSLICKAHTISSALSIDNFSEYTSVQLKRALCTAHREQFFNQLCAKPLHGKFATWACSDDVDTVQSFCWLQGSIHSESESTILAVQDQVLRTMVYQAKIMRCPVFTILCRFCLTREETIQHLLAGCEALAPTQVSISAQYGCLSGALAPL